MPDESKQPNIVFILADNSGWADYGCYGGTTPTPRIDSIARDGMQFTNYNVESQCTPTRTAIMTGRQSVRSGTYKAPLAGSGLSGLTEWEYTVAQLLSDAGYATQAVGKWHCGEVDSRIPTAFGFDEWWGYRNSVDEAGWTSYAAFRAIAEAIDLETPKLWESVKGGEPQAVGELDLKVRPFLDEQVTERAVDYIKKNAEGGKPFFQYLCFSHLHPPEATHPDFGQTEPTRLGAYADIIAEIDYRVGQILDAIDEAGIAENTIVVFSADNGAGLISAMPGGSSGPFRGGFFEPPFEGSHRVACVMRWPGKIGPGVYTNEMLSCHDWLPTFAGFAGASDKVPTDRPIDGVDASPFMLGQEKHSGRTHYLFFGPDGELMSCKWRDIKVILRYAFLHGPGGGFIDAQFPMFFDLNSDPGEQYNLFDYKLDMGWMMMPAMKAITDYKISEKKYPNIEVGTERFSGYRELRAKAVDTAVEVKPKSKEAKDKIGEALHHHRHPQAGGD